MAGDDMSKVAIENEIEYQQTLKEIDEVLSQLPVEYGDRLDVLVTLVEAYEVTEFPIPKPDNLAGVLNIIWKAEE